MESTFDYLPNLLQGAAVTAYCALLSIVGSAVIATVLGVARSSASPRQRLASAGVVEFLRGASALIYLFWIFYALPMVPGAPQLSPLVSSILVLSLVGGAYGAEIVRSGIQSVAKGQMEACLSLGLTRRQGMWKVIFPQSLSQIVPAFGSLAVDIVKWTAIVSFVGVKDVMYIANSIRTITYETTTVYVIVGLVYWFFCLVVSFFFMAVERRLPLNRMNAGKRFRFADLMPRLNLVPRASGASDR